MSQNLNHPLEQWRERQVSRLFDRLFDDWSTPRFFSKPENNTMSFNPSTEVSENKSSYSLKFDLPGLEKDKIKIDLNDKYLTVSGERKEEKLDEGKKHHFSEVYYGSFSRSFSFPTKVDAERVEAKYENGVLTINVPKAELAAARQITVR